MKLQGRGIQNLSKALSVAESLVEFSHEDRGDPSKSKHEDKDEDGRESPPKERPKSLTRGRNLNAESPRAKKPLKCFLCIGDHIARECPVRKRLAIMLATEEKEKGEATRMGSLQILSSMKSQARPKKKGLMYVEVSIKGHKLNALIDIGASNVFISEEAVTKLNLKLKKSRGWLKTVNSNKVPTAGIARGVNLSIGA